MLNRTATAALPLASLLCLVVACAPPSPDPAVGNSTNAFSGGDPSVGPKLVRATVGHDPSTGLVTETAVIPVRGQSVRICHAYEDGTEAQKHACDDYPNGYVDMTCIDVTENGNSAFAGNVFTDCRDGGNLGTAPFDQGDGTYTVYFVNRNDPSDRKTSAVRLRSDFFLLKIDGKDYPPYAGTFLNGGYYGVPEGSTTPITGSLRLTIEVQRDLASEINGCAGGFSTAGLTAEQVATKDAELLAGCAAPNASIDGRDGWLKTEARPTFDRSELTFDATPFVAPQQHLVFAFEVDGVVRSYIFTND